MRKKVGKAIIGVSLFFLVFFIQNGIYENIQIQNELAVFMQSSVFVREEDIGTNDNPKIIRYYNVSRETTLDDERPSIYSIGSKKYAGSPGDIFVTKYSPFPELPVIHQFISFFWGGHVGIIFNRNDNPTGIDSIEAIGNGESEDDNGVDIYQNSWRHAVSDVIGLRLKKATMMDYQGIIDEAKKFIGKPYNYTFIFNRQNSFYCSDVVNQAVKNYGHGFSIDDGLVVTVNDIILAKDTYIFYYHYFDEENVKHVYYIGD